jgi:parvulin-like peptidyl-prolyl isomerase
MKTMVSLIVALLVAILPLGALCETPDTPAAQATPIAEEAAAADETEEEAGAAGGAEEAAEADPNRVVATVDGDGITAREVEGYFQSMAGQYSAYLDVNDEGVRSMLMEQALNYAIQLKLMQHKAAELGLDKLTDEESAELDVKAQEYYDSLVEYFVSYLAQMGVTGDEAKAQAEMMLEQYGYFGDEVKAQYRLTEILKRVQAHVTDPITVSDEDVKTAYDAKVADQKASYDSAPSAFCAAKTYGNAVYYVPEGIRTVKHILIKPEKIDEINALKAKLADEATAAAEKVEAQTQLDALLAEPQPKLDEVMGKISAGEDFQGLIDAYGEDPGMQAGAANAEIGYYVSEGASFDKAFLEAALALGKAGDVSEPVLGSYGYHIIRYESDVPAGEVGLDPVKEALSSELLAAKRNEVFTTALDEWRAAAAIKMF